MLDSGPDFPALGCCQAPGTPGPKDCFHVRFLGSSKPLGSLQETSPHSGAAGGSDNGDTVTLSAATETQGFQQQQMGRARLQLQLRAAGSAGAGFPGEGFPWCRGKWGKAVSQGTVFLTGRNHRCEVPWEAVLVEGSGPCPRRSKLLSSLPLLLSAGAEAGHGQYLLG